MDDVSLEGACDAAVVVAVGVGESTGVSLSVAEWADVLRTGETGREPAAVDV